MTERTFNTEITYSSNCNYQQSKSTQQISVPLSNINLDIRYNDGELKELPLSHKDITVKGFDNTKTGKNTVTVEYSNKGITFG